MQNREKLLVHKLYVTVSVKNFHDSMQILTYLNQACTYLWPACDWFLKIVSVWTSIICMCVCVHVCDCVCVPLRLLITSGVIWCDIDPYDWLNKFYGFFMAAAVGIISRHG